VTRSRRLRWAPPPPAAPAHPYRDSLLVYGFLAVVVVLFAWVTGGSVWRAALIALVVWIAASAWSIARWRQRLRRAAEDESS
jgi:hypothetical protein